MIVYCCTSDVQLYRGIVMKPYILASQSPRRKELCALLGYPFVVEVADIDEVMDDEKDVVSEIKRIAQLKASTIFNRHRDCVVLAADTIVCLDGKRLGKPKDSDDAKKMLRLLSNTTHQVITGVCIMSCDEIIVEAMSSDVVFNYMSDEEIDDYIASNEPMDKAGSYGIQGIGGKFIKEIHGDFYSIMGLPLSFVYQKLKALNKKTVLNG